MIDKIVRKKRRQKSIRKKISGSSERPRMCVHKSNKNIYVQIVDDLEKKTICGLSTDSSVIKGKLKADTHKNINFATALGEAIAKSAVEKGVKKVVFDRSGYKYHGTIKALADAARKNGLEF